ncbi:MAG TPA: ultraviolet light resistance protein A, partial [Pseudomonas sp.]|nr:ultraviolet light resistance protein A [Pseudomonas sp.]
RQGEQIILRSANPKFPPRYLLESEELYVWGVVPFSVRFHGKY